MSNVFERKTLFFPTPQLLVLSGWLGDLSAGALRLYLLLLFLAQQKTKVELEQSNSDIRKLAKLSPNTIRRARTELWEAGLVELKHPTGGAYIYVVLNPETHLPLPHPKARLGTGAVPSISPSEVSIVPASCSPSWSEIGDIRQVNSGKGGPSVLATTLVKSGK